MDGHFPSDVIRSTHPSRLKKKAAQTKKEPVSAMLLQARNSLLDAIHHSSSLAVFKLS